MNKKLQSIAPKRRVTKQVERPHRHKRLENSKLQRLYEQQQSFLLTQSVLRWYNHAMRKELVESSTTSHLVLSSRIKIKIILQTRSLRNDRLLSVLEELGSIPTKEFKLCGDFKRITAP